MTTPPPPEPAEPAEPGPERPAEPAQPPSSSYQTPVDASSEHTGSAAEAPETAESSTPRYPAPPPLPPEAYPTYSGGRGYEYGAYGAPPVRRNNNMGVAALVLGVVAFLIGPCSILAVIFGRIGLNRVARGEATNRGVAQAGFVLGFVTLALWILGLILLANRH